MFNAPMVVIRRMIGVALLLMTMLPVHGLLSEPGTGVAGQATALMAASYTTVMWSGLAIAALVAAFCALLPVDITAGIARMADRIVAAPLPLFTSFVGIASALVTAAFSLHVRDGWPVHIDSVAQFLHARHVAAGLLAAPAAMADFWTVQNTIVHDGVWLSQYPPLHVLLLAAFIRAGAPWLLGPLLAAAIAAGSSLLAHRLWSDDPRLARAAALLCASSPFILFLSGTYMNHATAAAFIVWGGYSLARAAGGRGWAIAAGVLFSAAFAVRPLDALAASLAFALTLPAVSRIPLRSGAWLRALLLASAGALPGILALMLYNTSQFGGPATFGYDIALGPSAGLGFGTDPWGNSYGPLQAVAYTSAELTVLGIHLHESILPPLLIVGLYLALARRLSIGARAAVAWAFVPLAAGMLYWHHGFHFGPRMLLSAAPGWCMLLAASAFSLVRSAGNRDDASVRRDGLRLRNAASGCFAVSIVLGLIVFTPQRAASYTVERVPVDGSTLPEGSVVFVHGGWTDRTVARLAASGIRLDQVETLLRQNDICDVHEYATSLAAGDVATANASLAGLSTVPHPVTLSTLEIGPGSSVRTAHRSAWSESCLHEANSDRFGVIDPSAFVWRGVPPAAPGDSGTIFVRDLGPARNRAYLAAHQQRRPWMLMVDEYRGPVLVPYDSASDVLWDSVR